MNNLRLLHQLLHFYITVIKWTIILIINFI